MKIAVISDIHENFHNLILCMNEIEKHDISCIICLGDFMNAGIAKVLSIQAVPVYAIWGNNDGEQVEIMNASYAEGSNLTMSLNCYDFLEVDGKKIFITHYDDLAVPMAKSGLYDAVFYGHNHTMKIDRVDETWVVNPGELCAQKTGTSNFAIYDTDKNEVEIMQLENIITLKSDLVSEYLSANKERLNFRSEKVFRM